jgi:hypothetical protein
MSSKDKTRRVQMELSQSSFDRLNHLKELTEASSYTDVMKDALRLYEYIVQKDSEGTQFLLKSKSGDVSEVKIFA